MVQSIGPSSATEAGAYVPRTSAGVLQSQLARYQVQLDDWCNCPSGKTPEGKEKIRDLTDKVDAIKAQLKQVAETSAQTSASRISASAGTASNGSSDAALARGASGEAGIRPPSVYSPLGSRIDVYA